MANEIQSNMAVTNLIREIDHATENSKIDMSSLQRNNQELLASARRLVSTLESTEEKAWRIVMAPFMQHALMAVIKMGVFDIFTGSKMSAEQIAARTGADRVLVVRLMRALLINNIFIEIGPEEYSHNALSRRFSDKVFQDFINGVARNGVWTPKLADFLKSTDYRNPLEPNNGLLQYAVQTKLGTIDWLKENPEELDIISASMGAMSTYWRDSTRSAYSSLFPTDKGQHNDSSSEVLIVDVGGGRGLMLEDFCAHRPDLKGRMIFQDVPEVIKGRENAKGIEAMPHDFFTPQPVKAAHVYIFRHVLHDWPDEQARQILLNVKPALAPHSRIVILDQVVPTQGASLLNVGVDICMMLFSGMERSEKQWTALLDSAGLKVLKITPPKPGEGEVAFDSMIEAVPIEGPQNELNKH